MTAKPRAKVTTLGGFIRSWDDSRYRYSTEEVIYFAWGPIMILIPRRLSGWGF